MPDSGCVINVDGSDYYYPCDRKDDINVINGYLINTGSSTITLYSSFPEQGVNNSGYPRITMPSNTKAYYRATSSSNYQTLSVSSVSFVNGSFPINTLLLIVLIGVMVCQLFKH